MNDDEQAIDIWMHWVKPESKQHLREWCSERDCVMHEHSMEKAGYQHSTFFSFASPADEVRFKAELIKYMKKWFNLNLGHI